MYAAGVVLYELLTGSKPHEGESPIAGRLQARARGRPAAVASSSPGIPAYVDALVARATARDRAQRPADAGVLLHQLHRVAQALADGVRDDAELTTDLALPVSTPEPVTDETNAFEILPITPPVDEPPMTQPMVRAGRWTIDPEPTASTPRPVFEPQQLGGLGLDRGDEPPVRVVTGRGRSGRSRRGPVLLVVALVIALAAGLGAYWFGWARYTATPGVIGLTQKAAVAKLDHAGLDAKIGTPAYSETVAKGHVVGTDPDPGSRVLDHGTVTLTISLGKERYAVPKVARMTVDQAQDALLAAAPEVRPRRSCATTTRHRRAW